MLAAMFAAPVGDDVFGDDPSVQALEEQAAALFGMEAALFCASGTMTNQVALHVHLNAGEEVICEALSHIYLYEGGGLMANARASVRLLHGDRGRLTARQVEASINNPDDIHAAVTRVVSLENTMNKGGGSCYDFAEIERIRAVCDRHGLVLHLDGARLFNALVETPRLPADYGRVFDSISVCLSKGLGCPVGSLLLGSQAFIRKARRVRKRLGGGWRQAGYLAAAGLYALEHHRDRLRDDHRRARELAQIMARQPEISGHLPVETNILIVSLHEPLSSAQYVARLRQQGILAAAFGPSQVRFVTHLDFTDMHLTAFEEKIG